MESSVSPKLLLALLHLLLLAPVLQLQARELGGSKKQHVGGLPSAVLVLPSSGVGDNDNDGGVIDPPKLNDLPAGVVPPAPQPGKRPEPVHEPLQDVVWSPDVTGNNENSAPPSPTGNPPSHDHRLSPAADLLHVFWDVILQVAT